MEQRPTEENGQEDNIQQERRGGRERFWRQQLEKWGKSGKSKMAYCRQKGLRAGDFYRWQRELRLRDNREAQKTSSDTNGHGFIPVRVAAPGLQPEVEIVLRNGRSIRLGGAVEIQQVRQLVAALEDTPC